MNNDDQPSAYAIGYSTQWYLAIIVALSLVAIGAIQTIGPEELGIPTVAFRWLGIVAVILAAAQAFLPRVTAPPIANYEQHKRSEAIQSVMEDASVSPPATTGALTPAQTAQIVAAIKAELIRDPEGNDAPDWQPPERSQVRG